MFYRKPCSMVSFDESNIMIKNISMNVYIAESYCELNQGLMNIHNLKNDGMLFILPNEMQAVFWMKNTYIDLSIAFIDSKGMILEIQDMDSYDWNIKYFSKSNKIKYALEVKKGFFKEKQINIGDFLKYEEISN